MLQGALWVNFICSLTGRKIPDLSAKRLAISTKWLADYVNPLTGKCPNLGHNDGSCILPLSGSAYFDYRPVVQTASLAFLGKKAFKAGNYDENYLWLGLAVATEKPLQEITSANVNRVENSKSTVFLQALNYTNRPAHADQLHVDLWHKGENIALDPGTFQYNAAPPWDNGLARSLVHNTISFDGLDQMTRYSRFLWLDWANARIVQVQPGKSLTACHDGYRRLGIRHQRSVECQIDQGWLITDFLILSKSAGNHIATLNWNFPDEQYHFLAGNLEISFDKFNAAYPLKVNCQRFISKSSRAVNRLRGKVRSIHLWVGTRQLMA